MNSIKAFDKYTLKLILDLIFYVFLRKELIFYCTKYRKVIHKHILFFKIK